MYDSLVPSYMSLDGGLRWRDGRVDSEADDGVSAGEDDGPDEKG